ncbi:hypothetical protein NC653_029583 [Populus alba x Populus x berolinensis]|uniref:Uncharacterized protein n=1 Tax=Populus alba x Populus x berolinensis TaxID=444605 RepID=A0AAD6Q4N0_9ROSI|nr:hypothetical protein NC653_029583 [Populus alba x Populus x berolinensis]
MITRRTQQVIYHFWAQVCNDSLFWQKYIHSGPKSEVEAGTVVPSHHDRHQKHF